MATIIKKAERIIQRVIKPIKITTTLIRVPGIKDPQYNLNQHSIFKLAKIRICKQNSSKTNSKKKPPKVTSLTGKKKNKKDLEKFQELKDKFSLTSTELRLKI
jgi:hypothetical protein